MEIATNLGFRQIEELLQEHCLTPLSRTHLEEIHFSSDWEEICRLQEENEEFRQILLFEPDFSLRFQTDLRQELKQLQVEGSRIGLESLAALKECLESIQSMQVFFRVEAEKEVNRFPRLHSLSSQIYIDNQIVREIGRLLNENGQLRDNASEELARIRRQIFQTEREIEKNLKKIMVQAKQDRLMEADAEMTIRDGRLCLPISATNKRKLKGFIHDESATGQTVFIEPQEVFDANNDLRDLQLAERREIQRILLEISQMLRPHIPDILAAYQFMGYMDFVRAKAKLALEIGGVKPIMVNKPFVHWEKARHPLLLLSLQKQGKPIVPMDITLDDPHRILIISGPNAGGKSVCLKTIGLLQYMFQCGLPVSVSENSEFGCFRQIMIDIGDNQSIENDLSTYSSHLKNMQEMLQSACGEMLFLIDELGGGTDPQYGGAIAEAVLEQLARSQAKGVVTTHFGNLKTMAEQVEGIFNGAMLFDKEQLKPLFKLQTGKAGSSFTFDIAEQIGFPTDILQTAIQKIGTAQIDYEALLQKLELEKIALENERKMCAAMDNELAELIARQQTVNQGLQEKRHELIRQAKQEAEEILANANKIIEKTVREIKESKADKAEVKKIREEVHQFQEEVKKITPPPVPKIRKTGHLPLADDTHTTPLQVGDNVLIKETQTVGQVLEIKGDDIVVSFHSIHFRTTVDKVQKTKNKPASSSGNSYAHSEFYSEMNRKAAQFHLELDIRGMRAQEAIDELEHYIDDALLLQIHEVRIIHGKGDGILRKVVREFLAKNSDVKHFRDEAMERGGYGATVVEI